MKPLNVKIFRDCSQNIGPACENQINQWLDANPEVEIVSMLQSESMASAGENAIERNLSITILYRALTPEP